ncbi:hypothetical protein F5Y13DRAFT_173038 [Hypoxylon sp. FL1857]|nr:hypothetical protein F5Y13DRAFT_173038 [Hypoxylon sp. FL1857]
MIDLERYINMEVDLRHSVLPGLNHRDFKTRLKRALLNHAQGVFRWIKLQLEIFFDENFPFELEEDVENELQTLESGTSMVGRSEDQRARLNHAYNRLLNERRQNARQIVSIALRWVLCSVEPLTSDELTEAVTISRERTFTLATDKQLERISFTEIGRLCSNFLLFVGDKSRVKFSHHSVKEFLLDPKYCDREFLPEICHTFIAESCLWYIYHCTKVSEILDRHIHTNALQYCSSAGSENGQQGELRVLLRSFCLRPSQTIDVRKLGIDITPRTFAYWDPKRDMLRACFVEGSPHAFIAACVFNLDGILQQTLSQCATSPTGRQFLRNKGLRVAWQWGDYWAAGKSRFKRLSTSLRRPLAIVVAAS